MAHKLRFVLAGLAIVATSVAASLAASGAASAAPAAALLAPGGSRYAAVFSMSTITSTHLTFVDLPGLSTSITIPAGKLGDVLVFFCGDANQSLIARAIIGGVGASPHGAQITNTASTAKESRCVNFYRLGVPAGTPTIKMQWAGVGSMDSRSMMVVVNIH
jgi:hypothetical protein